MSVGDIPAVKRGRLTAVWRHPNFLLGAILTVALIATALVSLVWTPYAFDAISVPDRLQGPSAAHWLGGRSAPCVQPTW